MEGKLRQDEINHIRSQNRIKITIKSPKRFLPNQQQKQSQPQKQVKNRRQPQQPQPKKKMRIIHNKTATFGRN